MMYSNRLYVCSVLHSLPWFYLILYHHLIHLRNVCIQHSCTSINFKSNFHSNSLNAHNLLLWSVYRVAFTTYSAAIVEYSSLSSCGCVNSRAHIKYTFMIHLHIEGMCAWQWCSRECARYGPFTRRTKYIYSEFVSAIFTQMFWPCSNDAICFNCLYNIKFSIASLCSSIASCAKSVFTFEALSRIFVNCI